MFMVEIAGMRVLYTGDYSRQPDRHLSAADLPDVRPDIGAPPGHVPWNRLLLPPSCVPVSSLTATVYTLMKASIAGVATQVRARCVSFG